MSRVFRVTPKRVKRTNGTVLTPEMEVTVTTQSHTSDPFYNGVHIPGHTRSLSGSILRHKISLKSAILYPFIP